MRRVIMTGMLLAVAGGVWAAPEPLRPADPQGIDLPSRNSQSTRELQNASATGLKSPNAKFAKLKGYSVFLDARESGQQELNCLRILPAGEKDMDKAAIMTIKPNAGFSEVVDLPLDGQLCKVLVNGSLFGAEGQYYIMISLTRAMSGACDFGGKTLETTLVDATDNLSCFDRGGIGFTQFWIEIRGDYVLVKTDEGSLAAGFLGNPIWVDGAWYDITVESDRSLKATKVEMDSVAVKLVEDEGIGCQMLAINGDKVYASGPSAKSIRLPLGKTKIIQYLLTQNGKSDAAKCRVVPQGAAGEIEIKSDGAAGLTAGLPLKAKVSVSKLRGTVTFQQILTDAHGWSVKELKGTDGQDAFLPSLSVTDADGKVIHEGSFEYG